MRKINLPLILDTLFTSLCAFLLFFTALRFYTKNAYLALGFAVFAAILFGMLGFIYISRKQNRKLLISRDEKRKKLLSLHLSLSSDESICKLFEECLKALNGNAETCGGKVVSEGSIYFFNFKMQPLSEDDVAAVIKYKTDDKKIIFCCRTSAEAAMLADNFLIDIKQIDYVYGLLKEKNLMPEKFIYEGAQKISVWKKIKARFSRKICLPMFWSGAALLLLSYFTFYPIYYIVFGGILLLIAAVALVFN